MKIIDPHLHLFALELGNYHWLKAENPPFWLDKQRINKNFDEANLTLNEPLSLAGFIHIEAGFDNEQPWRELAALEQNCNKPFRAIANIDLTAPSQHVNALLEKFAEFRSFVGVRHLLDEQALSLLTNKQVLANINILNENGLIFEVQLALIEHATVNSLSGVILDNPEISFIINHAGFPPADIDTSAWQLWQSNLTKLSAYPNVAIKCSGWEMTDRHYNTAWLNENLSIVFTTFGAKRVMLASNFPLCLFSHSNYQAYWQSIISSDFFQALNKQEKSALCYDNALSWYRLASTGSE
ncbi:MAG: amidohydrolase family protein [Colwellia sp.]|jgi:predicted TIM-barrel fold metal-dependent hydrolase|nr:amidohydrolase family protein [Colwellia sp.]